MKIIVAVLFFAIICIPILPMVAIALFVLESLGAISVGFFFIFLLAIYPVPAIALLLILVTGLIKSSNQIKRRAF